MKSVTEFAVFTLNKGLQSKAALAAEGKTPEEIQTNLGETFKYEGEKLGYFVQALEVAGQHTTNLKRVLVMRLNEGEKAPAKATQQEDLVFVPEFLIEARAAAPQDDRGGKGGKGGRGGGRGGPGGGRGGPGGGKKDSPWGHAPVEKGPKKTDAPKA